MTAKGFIRSPETEHYKVLKQKALQAVLLARLLEAPEGLYDGYKRLHEGSIRAQMEVRCNTGSALWHRALSVHILVLG